MVKLKAKSAVYAALISALTTFVLVGATQASAHAPAAAQPRALWYDLDQLQDQTLEGGSIPVRTTVVHNDSGSLTPALGRAGQGMAMRTPSFAAVGPRAVLAVTALKGDPLSPRWREFIVGADVQLDDGETSSNEPGSTDNGDNIVQRGLFDEQGQYKLQVDHRLPSCRVRGSLGTVWVEATTRLAEHTWYHIQCQRTGGLLTLTVIAFTEDGTALPAQSWRQRGLIGDVRAKTATEPLSIGGKLVDDQKIAGQVDQFNGLLDNISYQVL